MSDENRSLESRAKAAQAQSQVREWKKIALTDPGRVVRALELEDGQTTIHGDTPTDIPLALQAVSDILSAQGYSETKAWDALVYAGIADALCRRICSVSLTRMAAKAGSSDELSKTRSNEMPSSYYQPLRILSDASHKFQQPLKKTDEKIIAALRINWTDMTATVWDRPENTLLSGELHVKERVAFAQLVGQFLLASPTFLAILYHPDDLTIQIVARFWKHSRQVTDTRETGALLHTLLTQKNPRYLAYIRNNGLQLGYSKLLSKILLGVGPSAFSSKAQQAKALMAAFAEHFIHSSTIPDCIAVHFLLQGAIETAKKDNQEPEVGKALLKSTPLWNSMLRLLKKLSKPFCLALNDTDARTSSPRQMNDEEGRGRVIQSIILVLHQTLFETYYEHPEECEDLVRILVNGNFFGALEDTIDILVKQFAGTMQLTHILTIMDGVASKASNSVRRTFATQFPRWRILATLFWNDVKKQQVKDAEPLSVGALEVDSKLPKGKPDINERFWDHDVWRVFGLLQFNYVDKAMCGKRGCEEVGRIVCTCEGVKYCSISCQTKDERDHKLVCGWVGDLKNVGVNISVLDAIPSQPGPAQTVSTKKKKKQTRVANHADGSIVESRGLEEVD